MEWYHKKLHFKKLILVLIFFISTAFFLSDGVEEISADTSSVCCTSGASIGDICTISTSPPVLGHCRLRDSDIPAETYLCTSPERLFCDDNCCDPAQGDAYCHPSLGQTGSCSAHNASCPAGYECLYSADPGTYSCHCTGPDTYGQYNCNLLQGTNACNPGYKPSCSLCGPGLGSPSCNVGMTCCTPSSYSCLFPCIPGSQGDAGAYCNCNVDCKDGLYCNPYSHTCFGLPTNTPNPGSCVCLYDMMDPNLCNVQPDQTNCNGSNVPNCQYDGGNTYTCSCFCVTPTPGQGGGIFICQWNNNPGSSYGCNLPIGGDQCIPPCWADCTNFGFTNPTPALECNGQHTCFCPTPSGPTPTSSAPPSCVALCPPAAYPSYHYPQCFEVNMPDLPTPGVWDCWNTTTDCDIPGYSQGDCYCCLNAVLTPPQTTNRPTLNPQCTTAAGDAGINTAIGCIPVNNQNTFLAFVLRWALGIAGGVALILIVYGGFLYMTSAGDKQKITAARQLLTAAISGLLLIIFSVFILDLLGVRLLQIPGL